MSTEVVQAKMTSLKLAGILYLSFMTLVSTWNFVLSGVTVMCFYRNRNAKWPFYATNLFFMTLNMCIMGFVVAVLSVLAIVVEVRGSNIAICQILLAAFVSQLVQASLQSTYVFTQRCKTLLSIERSTPLGYTKQERNRILIFNLLLFGLSSISTGLYFSSLQKKPNFNLGFCTMRMYENSDSVQTITSLLITIPFLVNGLLFLGTKWRLAKKLKSKIHPTIDSSAHFNKLTETTILKMEQTTTRNDSVFLDKCDDIPAPDAKQSTTKQKNGVAKPVPTKPNIGLRSAHIRKALRDMSTLLLFNISMPFVYTIACLTGEFVESTRLNNIRSLFLTLTYVSCSLKTTVMLFRYAVVRDALKEMLICFKTS